MQDLVARGLLLWDKLHGTFDLHPVVRGYVLDMLGGEARAYSGKYVANYFSALGAPAYQDAVCLKDLADPIQLVQVLNLMGATTEAWRVLRDDLRHALRRLEFYDELLALIKPLFPNGWHASSTLTDDPGLVASLAGIALMRMGRLDEAVEQDRFAIRDAVKHGLSPNLCINLRTYSIILNQLNDLPGRDRVLALAERVAMAIQDEAQVLRCAMVSVMYLTNDSRLAKARVRFDTAIEGASALIETDRQLEAQVLGTKVRLLFRETKLTADELDSAVVRVRVLGRRFWERALHVVAGEWHQSRHCHEKAIDAFSGAIAMARVVSLLDTDAEARRGLSLVQVGRIQEARDAALKAEEAPPHDALATLYLALGEREAALKHAHKGFLAACANGVCHIRHWWLEECRAVLKALNEPEPVLPPFDPAKHQPFPWEADIHRMLAEHATKQAKDA